MKRNEMKHIESYVSHVINICSKIALLSSIMKMLQTEFERKTKHILIS
jgi:hypothetical protein